MPATQASGLPTRKVLAGGLVSLAGALMVWAAHRWLGWDIPSDAAVAVIGSVATLAGYLVPPHLRDAVVHLDADVRAAGTDRAPPAAGRAP